MLLGFLTRRRALRSAKRALEANDVPAAIAAAQREDPRVARDVLLELTEEALSSERLELARRLIAAVEDGQPDALLLRAQVAQAHGDLQGAARLYRSLAAQFPGHEKLGRSLASVELKLGDHDAALRALASFEESEAFETRLLHAKALFAAGRDQDALDVSAPLMEDLDRLRRDFTTGGVDPVDHQRASELHAAIVASIGGAEEVTVDAAQRLELDAYAGVNHWLLAAKLARDSAPRATELRLQPLSWYRERGAALAAADPRDASAHVQLGVAALRDADYAGAEVHFTRAKELDPGHFAAWSGVGAARMLDKGRADLVARRLPRPPPPDQLEQVAVDWPVFTDVERRFVLASLHPLRFALPRLAERGASIRVLPIDVRPVDLPELAELQGEKDAEDHRSYSALHGLAGERLAVVRVDALMQVDEQDGWTFAHELAHLVHHHLDDADCDRIEALHAAALDEQFAYSQYALSNEYELFACAYVEFLQHRYGLAQRPPPDASSWAALRSFLEELDARGS